METFLSKLVNKEDEEKENMSKKDQFDNYECSKSLWYVHCNIYTY